jgi:hypothetical protein
MELEQCIFKHRSLNEILNKEVQRLTSLLRYLLRYHIILSTAPQLSISQKALGTLLEDGNMMPKHVVATIHN